jgi:hypothetical protein
MHITAKACPIAACCDGTTCIETDQLGCQRISGANFLAPPNRTTATFACVDDGPGGQADTCGTGSCCYATATGSARCEDVITGQLATPALCDSIDGEYKGGARCFGCVCSAGGPPESCRTDNDCDGGLNGPCILPGGGACSGLELSQPPPCPVCDVESIENCQRVVSTIQNARLSDECTGNCVSDPAQTEFNLPGIRAADDFVAAASGDITSVCVWGVFIRNGGEGSGDNCNDSGPPEKFKVKIYADANGLPGTLLGAPVTTVTRKDLVFVTPGGTEVLQWQLALATGIQVTQGNTYWLEVTNNTDESSGFPNCDWFWAYSDVQLGPDSGNQYLLQDTGDTYTFDDAVFDGTDLAWCLNIANTVPAKQEAACCECSPGAGGSCTVKTLENCTNADGQWRSTEEDCVGLATPCPNAADARDNCSAKTPVTLNSHTPWNNFCTNTDGPEMGGNSDCDDDPPDALQNDVWFSYLADDTCDVIFETCDIGGEDDYLMTVYSDGTGTCPCPSSSASELDCSDDGCTFFGAASRIVVPVEDGVCYTIRVGGYAGVKGQGFLHVTGCEVDVAPPTPIADGTGLDKTRFVSFSVVDPSQAETALRIVFDTLHLVNPPYTGGNTVPYSAFENQFVYVGPPTEYVESGASGIPFMASFTQCTPHFQNWATVGLLHVTGPQIVPSSLYRVENIAASCEGAIGTADCQTGGAKVSAQLPIETTRWGDVRSPYNPPDPSVQPDISDVGALVDKFRGALGAPIKARGILAGAPGNFWGEVNAGVLSVDFGFSHISGCVDAFRGVPYPYKMGKCAGAPAMGFSGACTVSGECTGAAGNGAPPCNLYCP